MRIAKTLGLLVALVGLMVVGGERWDQSMGLPGLPGVLYAGNITPAALGEWTDGEILRAFTSGVSRDGTALFPLMSYHAYRRMDAAD